LTASRRNSSRDLESQAAPAHDVQGALAHKHRRGRWDSGTRGSKFCPWSAAEKSGFSTRAVVFEVSGALHLDCHMPLVELTREKGIKVMSIIGQLELRAQ